MFTRSSRCIQALIVFTTILIGCSRQQAENTVLRELQDPKTNIDSLIERLKNSPEDPKQHFSAALRHVKPLILDNRSQAWFQLQARTRTVEFQDLQQQLLKEIPPSTLIAETSRLDQLRNGILESWKLSKHALSWLGLSHDYKKLHCCASDGRYAEIDVESLNILHDLKPEHAGRILAFLPREQDSPELLMVEFTGSASRSGLQVLSPVDGHATCNLNYEYNPPSLLHAVNPPFVRFPQNRLLLMKDRFPFAYLVASLIDGKEQFHFSPKTNVNTPSAQPIFSVVRNQGSQLLTLFEDGGIRDFSTQDGKELNPPRHLKLGQIFACTTNPSLTLLIVAGRFKETPESETSTRLIVWNIDGRKIEHELQVPDSSLTSLAASNSNSEILTGNQSGQLHSWDLSSKQSKLLGSVHNDAVTRIIPVPGSRKAFTADRFGYLKCVDLEALTTSTELPIPTAPAAVSPRFEREAYAISDGIEIRRTHTAELLEKIPLSNEATRQLGTMNSFEFDSTDEFVLVGGTSGVLRWNRKLKRIEQIPLDFSALTKQAASRDQSSKPAPIYIAVSPRGKSIVAWNHAAIALFDPQTGQQRTLITPNVRFLRKTTLFTRNDNELLIDYQALLESGRNRVEGVKRFNLETGEETGDYIHGAAQFSVNYVPETNSLVTSGQLKHERVRRPVVVLIRRLDTNAVEQLTLPERHQAVSLVSPDGLRMLSYQPDPGKIFLWNFPERKIIAEFDLDYVVSVHPLASRLIVQEHDQFAKRKHLFRFHMGQ
ncbi:MAG: hypothetical protein KDA68_10790 [Planctomycetaceae bacterium]|nr:hypothetical protein [Planctomycetaceae bacterium]